MQLILATVTERTVDHCRVCVLGEAEVRTAGYTEPFRPRAASLGPGCLVAIDVSAEPPLVAWRWFPATVLGVDPLTLDEPFHGVIEATPVDPPPEIGDTVYVATGPAGEWRVDATAAEPERAAAVLPQIVESYARNGWT